MPSIIDATKVGNKIRELLKEKKMTQEELANRLNISKSAVSQNLRGKSVFDIQNLINIADIFNITLDELLELNTDTDQKVVTHYQKMVKMGIDSIKDANRDDLRIYEPDIYGMVLLEYVIKENNKGMFLYLVEHDILCVDPTYHRASDIYLMAIKYMLEEKINYVLKFVDLYTKLKGSFIITNKEYEIAIWGYFNKEENQLLVKELMNLKVQTQSKVFNWNVKREVVPLAKNDYIDVIAKYKLKSVLEVFCYHIINETMIDYKYVVDKMIRNEFYEGQLLFNQIYFSNKKLNWAQRVLLKAQEAALATIETTNEELILDIVNRKLYLYLTPLVVKLIELNQTKTSSYIIAQYKEELDFKEIGLSAIVNSNVDLVNGLVEYFKQDDLNYLLSQSKIDDYEMMIVLIKAGAKIVEKYYNLETFKKVNNLLEEFIKGDK